MPGGVRRHQGRDHVGICIVPAGHVLVVEDDAVIALDIETAVLEAGAAQATLCGSLAEARTALSAPFDFALLDVDLGDGMSFEIARTLKQRGTPFVFVTAARLTDFPADLADAPFIAKPFFRNAIAQAIRDGLGKRETPR